MVWIFAIESNHLDFGESGSRLYWVDDEDLERLLYSKFQFVHGVEIHNESK